MLAIRLPEAIEKRLEKLARRTGRTKSFYVRQAILGTSTTWKTSMPPNALWNASEAATNGRFPSKMP